MRRFRKATIKDVAARSGVSTTTVSNFVSGNESVCSPETAVRIREAVAALHYAPNSLTRGLRHGATTTIGVCMSSPLDPDVSFGFSFLERLWRGIMEQADQENYSLLHYPRSVRDGDGCAALLDGRVDGILLHGCSDARAAQLAAAGMPTILLTHSLQVPESCGAVWADEAQTVDLALEHLWRLGHRRIAHIAGPIGERASDLIETTGSACPAGSARRADIAVRRLEGYRDWMQRRQSYDPALIAYADAWSAPRSRRFLEVWRSLDRPPTAVLCANDAQALDLMAAAQQMGCRVPQEISIVGIDDSQEARVSDPPLTSVAVPVDVVGCEGIRTLLRLISGASIDQCRIVVPVTELSVRRSTSEIRG